MADDIVERIMRAVQSCPCRRRPVIGSQIMGGCERCDAEQLAVDEIVRLRAEVERLRAQVQEKRVDVGELIAQIVRRDDDIVERLRAEVVPCPGKGWDGNGVQHCAECCFGTGVDAATADELRVMVLARDAADTIKNLTAERDALRLIISDLTAEVDRLRAAGDALAKWLWRGGGDLADMIAAVAAWEEARRG